MNRLYTQSVASSILTETIMRVVDKRKALGYLMSGLPVDARTLQEVVESIRRQQTCFVSVVGAPTEQEEELKTWARANMLQPLEFGFGGDHAVRVRNDAPSDGLKLVVVWKEEERLHSLTRRGYVEIGPREVIETVCESRALTAPNEPQRSFWLALASSTLSPYVSLTGILEFHDQVCESDEGTTGEALRTKLTALDLLPDSLLLSGRWVKRDDIVRRLVKNAEMVERIQRADESDMKKLMQRLRERPDDPDIRAAYKAFSRISRGERQALKELDLAIAERLLSTSTKASTNRGSSGTTNGGVNTLRRFESLALAVAQLTCEGARDTVRDLMDLVEQELDSNEMSINESVSLNDIAVNVSYSSQMAAFIDQLVDIDRFGGTLSGEDATLTDVLDDFGRFKDKVEVLGDVEMTELEVYFRRIQEGIYPAFEGLPLLENYLKYREALVPYKHLLSMSPVAYLVSNPEIRDVARRAIEAYDRLINHLETSFAQVVRGSSRARIAYARFLEIDTLRIYGAETEVVLLPLHPLNLWKYVEYASLIADRGEELSDQEREILLEDVEDMPEPLLTFILPITDSQESLKLSFAKRFGALTLYLPRTTTTRDVQETTLTTAARKLAALYPFVKNDLRILLVDPESFQPARKCIFNLVEDGGFSHVTLIIVRIVSQRVPIVEKGFEVLFEEGRLSVEEWNLSSVDELAQRLSDRPVHIIGLTGVQEKGVDVIDSEGTRLHPLSLPHKIVVDPFDDMLRLEPRSMQPADDGPRHPFGSYHKLAAQLSGNPASEYAQRVEPSVTHLDAGKLLPWCQFLVSAGDLGELTRERDVIRLTSSSWGNSDVVFTLHRDRILRDIDESLRRLNYEPTEQGINRILDRLQRTGGDGLFTTISETEERGFSREKLRGQLAYAVALEWYRENIAGKQHTILSLDSYLARKWLLKRGDNKRSDFLSFRLDTDGGIIVDIIEVKGYKATSENEEIHDAHPSQQMMSVAKLLKVIFSDQGDLLVDRRREILRRQVFEALHDMESSDPAWVRLVDSVVDGEVSVKLNPLLIEVVFDENLSTEEVIYTSEDDVFVGPITRIRLGESVIQSYLGRIGARPTGGRVWQDGIPPRDSWDVSENDLIEKQHEEHDDKLASSTQFSQSNSHSTQVLDEDSHDSLRDTLGMGFEPDDEERTLIEQTARNIYRTLQDVGIQLMEPVDPGLADVGPSVIRFKIRLQVGERVANLKNRASDLMRELAVGKEPIVDNLPNTNYVYIDLPRPRRKSAFLRPVLEQYPMTVEGLTVPVGVTPDGKIHAVDLTKLPHMLVGGTTGSGKTMFLYSIIVSLAYRYGPQQVRMVLVDPKQTDFVFFDDLPHLDGGGVLTEPEEAINVLMDLIKNELSSRTQRLKETRARSLETYNARFPTNPLPPIVVIIDEFADLIDVMDKRERSEFEYSIKRLAQRARNVGIHLILATQRPTTEVVTGNLKTNLPCRVSFRLASYVDSRTILDRGGAEHLLGLGDMLLSWNGEIHRLQGLFIPDDDMEALLLRCRREVS